MVSRTDCFDVAIIGAGPAGSVLAIRLARRGIDTLILEKSGFEQTRPGESLAPAVKPLLIELGLWDAFQSLEPLPSYGTRSVWGEPGARTHCHLQNAHNLGWHVDRQQLDATLAQCAMREGAALDLGTTVETLTHHKDHWELALRCGDGRRRSAKARVVVDASGRNARISRRLGAKRILLDRLVAVCQRIACDKAHDERHILLETCPEGWWYSAPLTERDLMVMLMTDSDLCSGQQLSARFSDSLAQTRMTQQRLVQSSISESETPWVVSAISQRTSRYQDNRPWLATGDAALAVDPISGSGFVRALEGAKHTAANVERLLGSDDPATTIEQHEHHYDDLCTQYLVERRHYYHAEMRWQESAFWARRVA